ncbi:hypothetical protein [Pseudonocardia sp. TRM90224]|uniref:hypothetical protein n=1 Tax=Pseudonocardia sp. TRM90224 TaxID=2812678 RepID=UPI001E489411|nr:hypothetical protein [Pseudonocardia sp. TRM90224]
METSYTGSGPYCYANSLAMVLGAPAPSPSDIEVLTGSPFGMQFQNGTPYFDAPGWDPVIGLPAALDLLGWHADWTSGGPAADAVARLRAATREGSVFVGPVEIELLRHAPDMTGPIGSDHFVVVLDVAEQVVFHDPQGFPFATLPIDEFCAAWGSNSFDYPAEPFTMLSGFRRTRDVDVLDALAASLPQARDRLGNGASSAAAATKLAGMIAAGPDEGLRAHLANFAVKVGTRRLADAATSLSRIGATAAAAVATEQARLLGALQYPLVMGDNTAAAHLLHQLASTYPQLAASL